jgi:hypothetical protein
MTLADPPPPHTCEPPAATVDMWRPDWECGVCRRVWRLWVGGSLGYWVEVRGPVPRRGER